MFGQPLHYRPTLQGVPFHYNALTWFLEWQWEHFWRDARLEQLPTRIVREKERDLRHRGVTRYTMDVVRDKPWLRFKSGTLLPMAYLLPVAGGADAPDVMDAIWTPFGVQAPYTGAGVDDAGLGSETLASQFQQYRDVTVTGNVAALASPQIVLMRTITTSAGWYIQANGLGGADGGIQTSLLGGQGGWGANGQGQSAISTQIAPAAAVPYDPYQHLMAFGGAGGGGAGANGSTATGYPEGNIEAGISMYYLLIGCIGGGGGGNGAGGTTSGTGGVGGWRGGRGGNGSGGAAAGGGGGSGIGAGGGGGSGNTTGGTGGYGSKGGGCIVVVCEEISGVSGGSFSLFADALATGTTAPIGTNAGGYGGGGGGLALLFARHDLNRLGAAQASAAAGGAKLGTGGNGGTGSSGIAVVIRGN